MATDSSAFSVWNTLSTTTADTVTIGTAGGPRFREVEIFNPTGGAAIIYFTLAKNGTTAPTTAVSLADGTLAVLPGMSRVIDLTGTYCDKFIVSIVGSGNTYGIVGVPW